MNLVEQLRETAYWLSGRHKTLAYKAADELERLTSALPKTADGVTIVPGDELFCLNRETGEVSPPMKVLGICDDRSISCSFVDPETGKRRQSSCHNTEHYYSTRQAAEEAMSHNAYAKIAFGVAKTFDDADEAYTVHYPAVTLWQRFPKLKSELVGKRSNTVIIHLGVALKSYDGQAAKLDDLPENPRPDDVAILEREAARIFGEPVKATWIMWSCYC